jgi:hypothetical protein
MTNVNLFSRAAITATMPASEDGDAFRLDDAESDVEPHRAVCQAGRVALLRDGL